MSSALRWQRKMLTVKITCTAFVLLIQTLQSLASDDSPFQLTNQATGFCLVKTNNHCNDIRWTTGDRLLGVQRKKCLGVEGKSEGSAISFYDCDENSELQKWECRNETVLALKGQELYIELTADNTAVLSNTIGPNNHLTISGTPSGACTRTFRELYAIGGNAAGMPCMFPFLYKDQWYTDCTTLDSSEMRLWCAVETKYQTERWGYCPITTKEGWNKHPTTGAYYQLNMLASLTWPQAETSCKQQGASLLSISDPHEQAYIIALLGPAPNKLWIGLVLNPEHGWKWSSRRPYRYMKWDSGHPLPNPGHNCAIIDPAVQYYWQSSPCTKRLGYICHSNSGEEVPTQAVETGFCSTPWIPYNGHCFHINRTQKTWPDAQRDCRNKGGDLVSIRNLEDQSFVISQLGYESTDELWIGLNDRKTEGLFDWIDHSTVSFTSWEFGKPGGSTDIEDCVLIRGENGNWDDRMCEERHGSICMKMSASIQTGYEWGQNVGCKTGWKRHGSYCYFIGAQAKTFDEAKVDCKTSDSYLADVSNGVDNAFLVSLVGTRPEKHFWLGLSNQKNILQFVWTNRDGVEFTHWNANMPGRHRGCVAMATGIFAGLWDVLPCANTEKYICKCLAEGARLTPPPTTVQTAHCPRDWIHIGLRDICIKIFRNDKKTWYDARDYCRAIGGDLPSIHSEAELRSLPYRYGSSLWIGLSAPDPATGYVWSDGSPLQFQHWMDGEPKNKNNMESCTETQNWQRQGSWTVVHCETLKQWFCQIPGGTTPNPPPSSVPLYNTTSDGWREWNGNQYLVGTYARGMEEARAVCRRKHGDLVTINSEAERVFLWKMIQGPGGYYWIGLLAGLDGTHSWMDGSPVAFQSWYENQPRFLNNDETCVVMTSSTGFWHNYHCGFEYRYICKRSSSPSSRVTIAPTVGPHGGCPQNWRKLASKCYIIVNNQRETWDGARTQCKAMGGNLATINSRLVEVFLVIAMAEAPHTDLWIGLHRQNGQRFYWTDGQTMQYENWPMKVNRYPFGHHRPMQEKKEDCVMITKDSTIGIGKWTKKPCSDTTGYICYRKLDPSLPDSPKPTTASQYVKIANDSIKLVTKPMTWYEAKRHCEGDGAKLASLRNDWSQIYTEQLTSTINAPLWIGLNKKETGGYYKFIDGRHLTVAKWGRGEPGNKPCVYVDSRGQWVTASCTETMQSICMKSTDVPPPTSKSSEFPGRCPEDPDRSMFHRQIPSWIPFRQYCYLFLPHQTTWPESSAKCARYDGTLVSIEDPDEQDFILGNIKVYQDTVSSFWIGLYKTMRGTWLWLDKAIVDYSNWDDGEPTDDYSYAEIRAKNGKWRASMNGNSDKGYICKTLKALEQVPPTIATPVLDQTHSNMTLVVALVITAIAIGTVIALILYMRSGRNCIRGNYLLQQ